VQPPAHACKLVEDARLHRGQAIAPCKCQKHTLTASAWAAGRYDSGDHLKTALTTSVATALLAWGLLEFPGGHARAGQGRWAREALRWSADWLMACHVGPQQFVAQVGNQTIDHSYWGRPEDITPATYGARLVRAAPAPPAAPQHAVCARAQSVFNSL